MLFSSSPRNREPIIVKRVAVYVDVVMRAVTHLVEMHDGKQLEIASNIPNERKSGPPVSLPYLDRTRWRPDTAASHNRLTGSKIEL